MARSKFEKATGRRERQRGSFAMIPENVLLSTAYHGIRGEAARLLTAIAVQFNGHNNGNLCAAMSVLRKYGFTSADTVARSLKALLEQGLIIRTREGYFQGSTSKCALYALGWHKIDECPGKGLTVGPTKTPPTIFTPAEKQPGLSEKRSDPLLNSVRHMQK